MLDTEKTLSFWQIISSTIQVVRAEKPGKLFVSTMEKSGQMEQKCAASTPLISAQVGLVEKAGQETRAEDTGIGLRRATEEVVT